MNQPLEQSEKIGERAAGYSSGSMKSMKFQWARYGVAYQNRSD
jgi:hypothetical protein